MKRITMAILALVFMVASCVTSYAGAWEAVGADWKYKNDNGAYSANCWQWIDGKCYCFGSNGIMYKDCTTPDGYKVNKDGAWVDDKGVVQVQQAATNTAAASSTDQRLYYLNRWYGLPGESKETKTSKMQLAIAENGSFTDFEGNMSSYGVYPKLKTYEEMKKFLISTDWPNMTEMQRLEACFKRCATGYSGNYYAKTSYFDSENCVLVHHNGICQEFAQTLEALCKLVGLKANLYESTSKGHALTEVMVDGVWYAVDPTWAEGQPLSAVMWRSDSPELATKWPRSNKRP